ncbi:DUF6894 family protein [Belnapia moabensis]|uniref:DUF6894 family protein n=1 Tax=Belnapia moabensis TaxID=365533 RepID=UPI0012EE5B56|nr:hypothetical protein [Belnapia moabensis]
MQRMFLHIDTGHIRIEDRTGCLFKSLDEAKAEAVELINEVAFAWPGDGTPLTNFHVDICDEAAQLLVTVPSQDLFQAERATVPVASVASLAFPARAPASASPAMKLELWPHKPAA